MRTGVIVAALIAALGLLPVQAGAAPAPAPGSASSGDTGPALSEMSVSEVVEAASRWDLGIYLVGTALVLAVLFAGGLMRPGGFAKAGLRKLDGLPLPVWVFAMIVAFLAMNASASLLGQIGWVQSQNFTDEQTKTLQLLAGYGLGAVAGLGMLYIFSKTAPEGGLKLSFLDVPIGLGCFALAFPVVMLASIGAVYLHRELAGSDPERIAHPILQQIVDAPGEPWTWALIAAVVLGAPVFEELLFRVFGQSALLKMFKSPWLSIILAGLAFGLSHRLMAGEGGGVPWHAVLPITMLGICCGVAYERTRRVGVPITMHVCFNAMNIAIATTQQQG